MYSRSMDEEALTNPEELEAQVAQIRWYHTIRLPHGVITPGIDDTISRLERIQLPINLQGKTVLDIGAWDGSFSFEAERRGAARVLATDKFCWSGEGWGTKAGFNLVKKVLQSKVEDLEIDVLDLSPEKIGTFDIVLFLGVLYHMRHPLLALEHVFSVTKTQLILDTQMDLLGYSQPAMAFYPEKELNEDPTNWWGPNVPALIGMLKCVGFREVRIVYPRQVRLRTSLPWRVARAVIRRVRSAERISNTIARGRMVFHAFR
jgi:tRNA (mo5U34)-methyltransferase